MSYKAIVARIYTRPLPGADKLVIGSCGNYQVVVGIATKDGELGVFFETDGQLSPEFAQANDLIRRKNLETGLPEGGMFEDNRRVKSLKLRGCRSEGFWTSLDSFKYTGADLSQLKEGDQFDELNGHPICNKYYTPATLNRQGRGKKGMIQRDNPMFKKHIETGHFKRESQAIPAGSLIIISEKLHGTSQRVGRVLEETAIQRSWIGGLLAKVMGWPTHKKEWTTLVGTRNVILRSPDSKGYHGSEQFRFDVVNGLTLHQGEVLYGEVVGYNSGGSPIMSPHSTAGLKDKSLTKEFGNTITYDYGCLPGQCKFYVYRITQVNDEGHVVELSWFGVRKRCRELGLETVPVLDILYYSPHPEQSFLYTKEGIEGAVTALTEFHDGKPLKSIMDGKTLREGVVVRYESEHGVGWLKNKGFTFGLLEGYLKEDENFVDAEEAA
jgi:hypothetical protein